MNQKFQRLILGLVAGSVLAFSGTSADAAGSTTAKEESPAVVVPKATPEELYKLMDSYAVRLNKFPEGPLPSTPENDRLLKNSFDVLSYSLKREEAKSLPDPFLSHYFALTSAYNKREESGAAMEVFLELRGKKNSASYKRIRAYAARKTETDKLSIEEKQD